MPKLHLECDDCGAVFKLNHDMDNKYYSIKACPFCGESMDDEQQDTEADDDV